MPEISSTNHQSAKSVILAGWPGPNPLHFKSKSPL